MRDDLTDKLVHLTKGSGSDPKKHRQEAFETLIPIFTEKALRGGNGYIKGGHKCICFSEAPIRKLSHLLAEKDEDKFKYQPYGILVDKVRLYKRGGRPVIYGPAPNYEKFPEEMRYRHVRFWLSDKRRIDHTWEREWRHKMDSLPIKPGEITVVVPERAAKDVLAEHFKEDNWHYIVLSDLGVRIDAL